MPPDLAQVVAAWQGLFRYVRTAILTLVHGLFKVRL